MGERDELGDERVLMASGHRVGTVCLAAFALLGVSSLSGLLTDLDVHVALVAEGVSSRLLDEWFPAISTLWSPELCLLYGLIAALYLWRSNLGVWSLAPLAFLVLVPLEVAMKAAVHRPPMPEELLRSWPSYPVVNVSLEGTFFNGSSIRTGFFCFFLASMLWRWGGVWARPASVSVALMAVLFGFARVYGRYHWLSSELAGQLLGVALAFLVALPLVEKAAGGPQIRSRRGAGLASSHIRESG